MSSVSLTPPNDDSSVIREDNEGPIKMATNRFSSRRTRHVDVEHNIVRGTVEDGGATCRCTDESIERQHL